MVSKDRRTDNRRKSNRPAVDRRAQDIRMEHEKANTQNSQILWTCLVAVSLAVASIYKVSHPLTDERYVRQSRSIASQARPGYTEANDNNSGSMVRPPNQHRKVD